MCKYRNETNQNKITRQIARLGDEENAKAVMQMIDKICEEVKIEGEPMVQWLGLLNERGVRAEKYKGPLPWVEIYPSNTHGEGRHDRLVLRVGAEEVEVLEAGKSSHG
jgi:hypothetical protein